MIFTKYHRASLCAYKALWSSTEDQPWIPFPTNSSQHRGWDLVSVSFHWESLVKRTAAHCLMSCTIDRGKSPRSGMLGSQDVHLPAFSSSRTKSCTACCSVSESRCMSGFIVILLGDWPSPQWTYPGWKGRSLDKFLLLWVFCSKSPRFSKI